LVYEEIKLECGYRVDVLVENKVVVEIKSVDCLTDVHLAQVLTYLKIGDRRVGLLMNFNVSKMLFGIKRVVNKFIDSATSA
jgi:GxxExxY protein